MTINLPINEEVENMLLGRMLCSVDAVNEAFDSLDANDFFSPDNQTIFKAMYILFKADCCIEPESVCATLSEKFPEFKNIPKIFGISQYCLGDTSDNTVYIDIIKDNSIYRKIIYSTKEIQILASEKKLDTTELQGKILNDLELIYKDSAKKSLVDLANAFKDEYRESGKNFIEYIENKIVMKQKGISTMEGYSTGFSTLDKTLDGLNKSHYIILGARPGVGKSTFLVNLLVNLGKNNIKVGFFSLEMTASEVMMKFACLKARLASDRVKDGDISYQELKRLESATNEVSSDSLFIDDQQGLKLSQLTARAKRMYISNGIQVLLIDYIGEIKGDGKFASKQEEIQTVSRGIRAIAKNLNIPVICVAQLNRDSEKTNRKPIKSDLRESGQIEADAHAILLLHRPDQDDKLNKPGILQVCIVKNRFGAEKNIDFNFDKSSGEYSEMDYTSLKPSEFDNESDFDGL